MMINRFLFLLLLLVSRVALADAPITQYSYSIYPSGTGWGTIAAAADGQVAYFNANTLNTNGGQYSFSVFSVGTTTYTYKRTCVKATGASGGSCTVGSSTNTTNTPSTRQWCAAGSAPDTSKPLAQQCPVQCAKDLVVSGTQYYGTDRAAAVNTPNPTCFNSCTVATTSLDGCYSEIGTGIYSCDFTMKQTGGTCSVADASPQSPRSPSTHTPTTSEPTKAPDALNCPKGTVQAGISADGIPLCVGMGTKPQTSTSDTTTTKPPVTVTNADGSTTKTEQTDVKNPDGSTTTTTKTTTTGSDGTVTVVVGSATGNTPAGTPGKPGTNGTNGKDGKSLCETNPELSICRNSTVSGDCAAGVAAVACTGDAVQCAQLRYAAELACKQRQDVEDLKASGSKVLGDSILGGNDPKKIELEALVKGTEVDMSQPQLDQSGFVGGGSCLANRSISVFGRQVSVSFSEVCSNIQPLRAGVLAVAFIVAYLIVARSVLQA